jgi:hypothetical protein
LAYLATKIFGHPKIFLFRVTVIINSGGEEAVEEETAEMLFVWKMG